MAFEEQHKKITVTIGLIMSLIATAFFLGTLWERNQSLHKEVDVVKSYSEQEIQGLREDWERHNEIQKNQIQQLEEHFKNSIDNHEKIHHK